MKTLDRYIILHILGFTAIAGFALIAIYSFIGFVSGIGDTGQGNYGVLQLMVYTLLQMPAGLYTLLPIIAMLGTLMGLGALAAQSELTAMRAAGVSLLRIGSATLLAGSLLGIVGFLLGDWLAPASNSAAESYRTTARTGITPGLGGHTVWLRDGDSIFHIRKLIAEDHVADVEIFMLAKDMSLQSDLHVSDGRYQDGHWNFTGVSRTDIASDGTRTSQAPQMQWSGSLSPEVLRLFVLESESLTMPGLLRLIHYLDANGLDAANYRLDLWRKLIAPLTVMAMMLFAVPFVLGSLRSSGAGQRLLIGILVGVGFYVLNEVSANLGEVYRWPPALAATLPSILLSGIALYRLNRVS
ncbi:MAG: LPS export ABC transporter permease LptG [Stenotrophobium sp.]